MISKVSRSSGTDFPMTALERKISAFSQHSLFSSRSDEMLHSEHRASVVDYGHGHTPMTTPLTKALMNSHPDEFKEATQAPFLRLAGLGQLSKQQLSRWLSQDRIYAETYICFISSLIARVTLPYVYVSDKSRSLRWRIVNLLTGALQNIQREVEFFTTVAEQYDLKLDEPFRDGENEMFAPEDATRQYVDLFRSFYDDTTLPLIEGMVVLWATEQCYLSAWTYASNFTSELQSAPTEADADGGALREEFIPNWTSEEFGKFVADIAELTDLLADREQAGRKLEVYKAVWLHVLDIEKRFWPKIDGE